MRNELKVELGYNFLDSVNQAKAKNISLKQLVLSKEQWNEDPRVKGFLDNQLIELQRARLKESGITFNDGIEEQFPYNGFTALDLNIRKPLHNTFATRDVPMIYGGGALETDKGFAQNYATAKGRLASGNNNKVNLVDVNFETLEAPILPITLGLYVGYVDELKYGQIGFDIIGAKGEAVRISYQNELEFFAFVGHRGLDGTTTDNVGMARGLFNLTSDNATIVDLETRTDLTNKHLESMTTEELVEVFAGELLAQAESVAFEPTKLANKLLIYPKLYTKLVKPAKITESGTVYYSNLQYLWAQLDELSRGFGGDGIMIMSNPYLSPASQNTSFDPTLLNAGTNGTGRVVLYRQDPYVLRMRLAMDLTGGALVYDSVNNGMRRNYIAFIGTPLVYYKETQVYIDNGEVPTVEGD